MSPHKTLHFTIGPVQGFVAQARRTRDLWAGSFLLSFLAAQAMKTIIEHGGLVEFPNVQSDDNQISDPLLAAVMGKPLDGNTSPVIGSVPNRFKALVPMNFDPTIVSNSVADKWQAIAAAVFNQCLQAPLKDDGDRLYAVREKLWDQQIKEFWDINWVMAEVDSSASTLQDRHSAGSDNQSTIQDRHSAGSDNQSTIQDHHSAGPDNKWLDQRKNWRSRWVSEQHGEKCSLMGDLQELSTFSVYEAGKRREFWKKLAQTTKGGARNIRDGEYLCAISLVKRLFPTLDQAALMQTIGWVPGGDLKRLSNWPSTTYMAALPWLIDSYQDTSKHQALNRYLQLIVDQASSKADLQLLMSEQATAFTAFNGENSKRVDTVKVTDSRGNHFFPDDIDGDLLNEFSLANFRSTHLSSQAMRASGANDRDRNTDRDSDPDSALRARLQAGLSTLYRDLSPSDQALKPRSYYAILIMDGDRLGELLHTHADEAKQKISKPLSTFTNQVPNTVAEHNGLTIYAGGDDVLAMLPLSTALHCAHELNQDYRRAFKEQGVEHATASSAVLFVHHQYPLSNALKVAHHTLNTIAKEGNGRDSCAVSVLNSGGEHLLWVNVWNKFDNAQEQAPDQSEVNSSQADGDLSNRADCSSPSQADGSQANQNDQVMALMALVDQFKNNTLPRGFPHKLKRQFTYMQSASHETDGENPELTRLMQPQQLEKLFLAELLMTEEASTRADKREQAQQSIRHYLAASRHIKNQEEGPQQAQTGVQFDAGLIARFLTRSAD
ncbi:MAG: CRISPR-associated protein Cmr2 [Arenicella sp.]|jgi:CRISPR-associated protein Cmr2